MGYLSQRVRPDQIKPGDHIYTWRTAFTYSHHGIYVGKNAVIHFTAPEKAGSSSGWNLSSSIPSSCFNSIDYKCLQPNSDNDSCSDTYMCGFQHSDSGVLISCLTCFIGTGSLYLYQYEVSKYALVSKFRGGTCTTAKSNPPEDVIDRAIYLWQNGFGKYNVKRNNCEDFALYCKTGLLVSGKPATGSSGQVNFLYNFPWKTVLGSALPELVCSGISAITVPVAVGTVCWKRYKNDIGVRDDVVKVKVEDVRLFLGD